MGVDSAMRDLLLLTSTIEPGDVPHLVRALWADRRRDYLSAVEFYSNACSPSEVQLLFVENSGANVDDIRAVAAKHGHELAVISYVEDSVVSRRGKGNGEALMFDRVARWLSETSGEYRRLIKVTGRLSVKNINSILTFDLGRPRPSPYVCCRVTADFTVVDTKFFITDPAVFTKYFTGMEPEVSESTGRFLEHVCARRLARALSDDVLWLRFRRYPHFVGVSASTAVRYSGPRDWIRVQMVMLARFLARDKYW